VNRAAPPAVHAKRRASLEAACAFAVASYLRAAALGRTVRAALDHGPLAASVRIFTVAARRRCSTAGFCVGSAAYVGAGIITDLVLNCRGAHSGAPVSRQPRV